MKSLILHFLLVYVFMKSLILHFSLAYVFMKSAILNFSLLWALLYIYFKYIYFELKKTYFLNYILYLFYKCTVHVRTDSYTFVPLITAELFRLTVVRLILFIYKGKCKP